MSIPRSPIDVDSTKRLLNERIERGEITQDDVDLIKRGYRWMALSTLAGATSGLPIWFLLSRGRRLPFLPGSIGTSAPSASSAASSLSARAAAESARAGARAGAGPGAARGGQGRVQVPPLAFRIAVTSMISGIGSFLGFTVAGAAAAMEVNNKMVDSKKKMRVFEEVMIASRAEAEARRMGLPAPIPSASQGRGGSSDSSSGFPMPDYDGQGQAKSRVEQQMDMNGDDLSSVWDPEKAEMAREQDRERGIPNSGEMSSRQSSSSQGKQSAWDRLRQGSLPSSSTSSSSSSTASPNSPAFPSTGGSVDPRTLARTSNSSGTGFAGGGLQGRQGDLGDGILRKGDAERERERREFDELMERERQAGAGAGEAGFEKGKW